MERVSLTSFTADDTFLLQQPGRRRCRKGRHLQLLVDIPRRRCFVVARYAAFPIGNRVTDYYRYQSRYESDAVTVRGLYSCFSGSVQSTHRSHVAEMFLRETMSLKLFGE